MEDNTRFCSYRDWLKESEDGQHPDEEELHRPRHGRNECVALQGVCRNRNPRDSKECVVCLAVQMFSAADQLLRRRL